MLVDNPERNKLPKTYINLQDELAKFFLDKIERKIAHNLMSHPSMNTPPEIAHFSRNFMKGQRIN